MTKIAPKKKKISKQEKDSLDNFVVLVTAVVLVVGVFLAVTNNYLRSTVTSNAMHGFLIVLQWLGVLSVVAFTVYGVVKKDKKYYRGTAAGAAMAVIAYLLLNINGTTIAIAVSYSLLAVTAISSYTYYTLAINRAWENKIVRIIFYCVFAAITIAILTYCVINLVPVWQTKIK